MLKRYQNFKISKGNGKYRTIYKVIDLEWKERLKSHIPFLEHRLNELDTHRVSFAFIKGRNCVLNAVQHIGYQYTLSFDLLSFFDSIQKSHLENLVSDAILQDCFIDGAPRQGLPTSPLISNIAFLSCDNEILTALNSLNIDYRYTRYADDLTFSFNSLGEVCQIKSIVREILKNNGFNINDRKTKFQSIKNGRVIITGVALDKDSIYPTRKTLKKIRAATHQNNQGSLTGLLEWGKCKLPNRVSM
jgi:hypothetical protein